MCRGSRGPFESNPSFQEGVWNMAHTVIRFFALLFAALAMVPAAAHALELPRKVSLSSEQYLTVQQIYRGWSLLGVVVVLALVFTTANAVVARAEPRAFAWALVAVLCIAATQVVFWTLTQPANAATQNWSKLPDDWPALRRQWEYSHAGSAALNFVAFVAVALSILVRDH
jgi:hypothetical protein